MHSITSNTVFVKFGTQDRTRTCRTCDLNAVWLPITPPGQINNCMNSTQFRQLINLFEARVPGVEYEESDAEVIALLQSHDSQIYTKLAQKVERIAQLKSELEVLESEVKQAAREDVAGIFDATDAVKTRIIKTKSLIIQISKDPKATESPKYKDILEALTQHLTPELIVVLEKLKKTIVTVVQKSPGLKIKPLDESPVTNLVQSLNAAINDWAVGYDQELLQLQQELSS